MTEQFIWLNVSQMKTATVPAKRSYRLGARAETKQATRDRILDAAHEAMMTRWYDEVTVAELARAAGVSAPTLTNHFGDKNALVAAWGRERMSATINELRYSVEPGDLAGAVRVLVTDYESTGDLIIRALALEHRIPELTPVLDEGRAEPSPRGSRRSSNPICRRQSASVSARSRASSSPPTSTSGRSCAATWACHARPPKTRCTPSSPPSSSP